MCWKAIAREDGKDIACTGIGQMAITIGSTRSRTDSRSTSDSVTVTLRTKGREVNPLNRRAVRPVMPGSPVVPTAKCTPFRISAGYCPRYGHWVMGNGYVTDTHMGSRRLFW